MYTCFPPQIILSITWQFNNSHKLITLYGSKKPRIRKDILGGLALPNFLFYYWAANIRSMLHWCSISNQPPLWLQIEEGPCDSCSLVSLLCLPITSSPVAHSRNIIVKNCLKIWVQFRRHGGLHTPPLRSPVHSNPLFVPSMLDRAFSVWNDQGITVYYCILIAHLDHSTT